MFHHQWWHDPKKLSSSGSAKSMHEVRCLPFCSFFKMCNSSFAANFRSN
jgi:hypothetical protein